MWWFARGADEVKLVVGPYNSKVSVNDTVVSRYCSARPTCPLLRQCGRTSPAIVTVLALVKRSDGSDTLDLSLIMREGN